MTENIWAVGDCCKHPMNYPPSAFVADEIAENVA